MSQLPCGRVEADNMVTTRSKSKAQLRSITEHFPEELWIEVLSHLGGKDIGRAVCSTQVLANVRESVWRAACERRWPVWSQVAASADTHWKRQYELLELREKELEAVPCVQAINKLQTEVNPRHRMVLTEWLAEVARACANEFAVLASSRYDSLLFPVKRFIWRQPCRSRGIGNWNRRSSSRPSII